MLHIHVVRVTLAFVGAGPTGLSACVQLQMQSVGITVAGARDQRPGHVAYGGAIKVEANALSER